MKCIDDRSFGFTRREFVQAVGAGAAVLTAGRTAAGATREPKRDFEHGHPLKEFRYDQVALRGRHQQQFEQAHGVLMRMNEDSLLRPFRMAAGMPAPGWDLGGWYSATPALVSTGPTGPETFGQWISALSRYAAATGDAEARLKVERLVQEYAKTIEPRGEVFRFSGNPTYFYDKLVCGLQDAYEFAGVKSALGLISTTTTGAQAHLTGRAIDPLGASVAKASESYTVPENQFITWQRGGEPRHLQMARQYMADDFFFDPLSEGRDVLARRHAYSHVNALCSAAKAYLVLGEEKYLKAAVNGLAFVEKQSFATGGWGPGESFLPRPAMDYTDPETGEKKHFPAIDSLGDSLLRETGHFETPCGAYAHFKLTRYLLRITKNPQYGDSMERVMYNTVLGALPLNRYGKAFYQSNYHAGAHKDYFDGYGNMMEDEWPCCSGTLPQVAADYRISAYFNDPQGVYINLYIPSTLCWRQGEAEVSLSQSGAYPLGDGIAFDIQSSQPATFALRLRIPAWAQAPTLRINGKQAGERLQPGTFAVVRRKWRSGDRIELELPKKLMLQAADERHPDTVALVYGPVVLFALADCPPQVTRAQLLAARPSSAAGEEWSADSADGTLRLLPWWAIKKEAYMTYMKVSA